MSLSNEPATPPMGQILYFADPMCSWCWGFQPVVEALAEQLDSSILLNVLMGGLRPGTTQAMDQKAKKDIEAHWREVEKASGQPFNFEFFSRPSFVYNTEPAARAVVSLRAISPLLALKFLGVVQGAFYQHNVDVTEKNELIQLATRFLKQETLEHSEVDFEELFLAQPTRQRTKDDFALTSEIGVQGFPALLGQSREGLVILSMGYATQGKIEERVNAWRSRLSSG